MAWTQTDAHHLRRALAGLNPRNTVARPSAEDTYAHLTWLLDKAAKAIHGKPGIVTSEQLAALRTLVDDVYRTEPLPGPAFMCISWDYRRQPDLTRLAQYVFEVSGGTIHVHEVDTGTDHFALAISRQPLDDAAARAVWVASQ